VDAARFDQLTRLLLSGLSRRRMLVSLGGVLPALLDLDRSGPVLAAKKKRQKRNEDCPKGQKQCRQHCIREDHCCHVADCPAGQTCCHGTCQECCGQDAHCDNGNPCTQDLCSGEGTCLHDPTPDQTVCGGDPHGDFSFCLAGECLQCRALGQACTSLQQCCDWDEDHDIDIGRIMCNPHPIVPSIRFCCRDSLGPCQFSGDCCSGGCDDGRCTFDLFSESA